MRDDCKHERSHVLDSQFHGGGYASYVSRRIFCDQCRLQRWLDIEVALVQSQAELGIVPEEAARGITKAANLNTMDLAEVSEGVKRTGHSIVPLLWALRSACPGKTGEFVHFGATTQDIQDTAQSLEMRDVLDELEGRLDRTIDILATMARTHKSQLMVARTHSIAALPSTFGLKLASWIDELLRHRERLDSVRSRVLVAQLFGGVGTMAAFGPRAPELLDKFAAKLGLLVPRVGWHVARDRIAEYVVHLAMIAGTLARVADELRTLSRQEIAEVTLAWSAHQEGSSTMPHKRNNEDTEQVIAVARLAKAQVLLALDGMVLEHERDYRGIRLEWCSVADVSHYTLAAFETLIPVLEGMRVEKKRMEDNARNAAEALCTEAIVFELAHKVGKETAYRLVHDLSQHSQNEGIPLRQLVEQNDQVRTALGDRIDSVFDPAGHLGSYEELIERVLDEVERARGRKK